MCVHACWSWELDELQCVLLWLFFLGYKTKSFLATCQSILYKRRPESKHLGKCSRSFGHYRELNLWETETSVSTTSWNSSPVRKASSVPLQLPSWISNCWSTPSRLRLEGKLVRCQCSHGYCRYNDSMKKQLFSTLSRSHSPSACQL